MRKKGNAMIVYADVLIAVNWWIDFLLMCGIGKMAGLATSGWRLALGGLIGALLSLTLFLPPMAWWLSLFLKLITALPMVMVSFGWHGWHRLCRLTLLLFGLSAALAGLCGALYYFVAPRGLYVENGIVYYGISPILLVVLTTVCYGILWLTDSFTHRRSPAFSRYTVNLTFGGTTVSVCCQYDSGNHLIEPFSGCPVLLVERTALDKLRLPAVAGNVPVGWRMIPYESIGGKGLLPAFRPEKITVRTAGGERELTDCYVAICDRLGRGACQGLIGSVLGNQLT